MSLNIWTQPSGHNFGTFEESATVTINLPVSNDVTGVTYKVISGSLPGGLRLEGSQIVGTPYIVSNNINFTFCIRASSATDFADRTFKMSINGSNPPVWVTPAGSLPVGVNQQLYVLDSTYVTYQLQAFDLNEAIGSNLSYFIASGDGNLPPGLSLSTSGVISGFIKPALAITPEDGNGQFDDAFYDGVAYDFANLPTDGFDSYQYDDVFFDYNLPSTVPTSLNANYQFRVTVTDGVNFAQRVFKIFVVGTDSFRADSTELDGFAGGFTADSSFLRRPVWMTDTNLGTYRANNYITVPVALYDKTDTEFRLEATNEEVYAVTYQVSNTDNVIGATHLTISNVKGTPLPQQFLTFDNYISGATGDVYKIYSVTSLGNSRYRLVLTSPLLLNLPNGAAFYIGTASTLPPGTSFDVNTGEIYGAVPYQPQVTESYKFTITAKRFGLKTVEVVETARTFTIKILGNVTGIITWNSPGNLGSIPADYVCTLNINATSDVPNAIISYQVTSGNLPPELSLTNDGEIIGTPPQFGNSSQNGIVIFDNGALTFDHGNTTIDRSYTFTVTASDQYGYDSVSKEFTITLTTPNIVPYSNITTRPFLAPDQRLLWQDFINNTSIFTPQSVYRPNDVNFGVQTDLSMLVYAGIQTELAAKYIGAMGLNVKRKRFQFNGLKTALAIDPETKNTVYEVVYMQMYDPLEPDGKHLPLSISPAVHQPETITVDDSNSIWYNDSTTLNIDAPTAIRPDFNITVDSTGYSASDPNFGTYYPNSITNWQTRLSEVGLTERNYLPLWMRSIQTGTKQQLGYILAVPLCFCKPGTSSTILSNIEFSGFEFNQLDYTVDRFTINAVTGFSSDKYLVFRNDRITV